MARRTIVGLFRDHDEAQRVISELEAAGFNRSDISVIQRDPRTGAADTSTTTRTTDDEPGVSTGTGAAIGAGTGAALGGGLGLLAGAAGFFIPGIGPLLGIGPMAATIIGGAGIGAAAGGIAGALVNSGVPHEEAERYSTGVHRGHTLVTLAADEPRAAAAVAIFNRHNPINIHGDEFLKGRPATLIENTMKQTPDRRTERTTTERLATDKTTPQKLEVVEEQLQVGKREAETGGVRITKTVEERPVEEQVTLRQEKVNVERHPVDRPATAADINAFKEGTIEVTERREEPVIQKQARVIEEVIIDKHVEQNTQTVRDTVRRTDVQVEQMGSNPGQYAGDRTRQKDTFADLDTECRTNFRTAFPGNEYTYEQVQPAYRYGHDWASRPNARDWNSIESDARTHWEAKNPGTWDRFKDAIRYSYDRAKQKVTGHA